MKTTVQLDDPASLAASAPPVHLTFPFTAPGYAGHRGPDDHRIGERSHRWPSDDDPAGAGSDPAPPRN